MTNVAFDANDLQTANIVTAEIQHGSIPRKDAKMYAFAHANRSAIPFINYPSRTVVLRGKVLGSSIADLDSRLDTFRGYFVGKDKNLDIDYNGSTRRYIATLSGLSIERPGNLAYANFVAEFECTHPFGQNTSASTANSESGLTAGTDTFSHTYLGSAPFQLPVITITINSVTGGGGHISVVNDDNDQGITVVGQTFVATDVLVIDCDQRIVTLNGDEIDYLGAFIELPPGLQQLNYEDGFSARNFDITITYNPLWL